MAVFRNDHVLSFEPTETPAKPWMLIHVPYGSRVAASRTLGESVLIVPGEPHPLTAADAVERFRPTSS